MKLKMCKFYVKIVMSFISNTFLFYKEHIFRRIE